MANKILKSVAFPGITNTYKIPPQANEFSSSSTYVEGSYVTYQGVLYKCTSAITTAGDWTGSTNWTEVQIANELQNYVSDLQNSIDIIIQGGGSQYQGATEESAGVPGFLPGAELGNTDSFFRSDGTWSHEYVKDYVTAGRKSGSTLGGNATAEGYNTTASGNYAHAEGSTTTASGQASHAEGRQATASGDYAHAEGVNTQARGDYSHAEGYYTTASGNYAHAEGYYFTTASGQASHAEGYYTTASGDYAHAEGDHTTASVGRAHAEGQQTTASASSSHAEGYNTTASASSSHAEGNSTTASGNASHAEGWGTTASGTISHVEGYKTIANRREQHVFGSYNIADPSSTDVNSRGTYIEIVGNGTEENLRSNARTLDWNGNEILAGKLTVGTGPTNNMDVATKQYVDSVAGNSVLLGTISFTASWTQASTGIYTQTVTVSGFTVTSTSKIDLQPTASQISSLISSGVNSLVIENNNGTLTAYAVGAATTAMTVQCTATEVS